MRGTLLNTGTVALGAGLGLLVGRAAPEAYRDVALHGLGLVTCGLGIKMFLASRNPIAVALSIAVGGVIGLALGLHAGVSGLAGWIESALGARGTGTFAVGLVTSFVLFCVGPMTLLGCLEDALENKIDILSVKSVLDGIAGFFLAAATGAGVLVTAVLLLLFQGGITLAARPLSGLARNEAALAEVTGTGGAILLGTGLGLLGLIDVRGTNYLPAIVLAPFLAGWLGRLGAPKEKAA
jgi:uncharacterized membrane protein YqgA involved in biofilm formation